MWDHILVTIAVVFLTSNSLPVDSPEKQPGSDLKASPNGIQSNDYDGEEYADDLDGEPEMSDLEADMRPFEANDSETARPIQKMTFIGENTYNQPQHYDRRGHHETSSTYNSSAYHTSDNSSAPNSHDYQQTQNNFYSPGSASNSIFNPQGGGDSNTYDDRDYYTQAGPESAFNQTAYYEYAQNNSRSQHQGSNPEEESKSNETSYDSLGSSYGYNYRSPYGERSLDDRSRSQSQHYRPSDSERPEDRNHDDSRFRQSQDYSTERNKKDPRQVGHDYYRSDLQESTSTQENRNAGYNYPDTYFRDGQEQHYPQESSSERQREYGNVERPSLSYNDSQDRDRGKEDSRTNTSYNEAYPHGNAYNRQPEQRTDGKNRFNQSQDRSEIDESDQEVTYDDIRGPEIDYYDRERSLPAQVIDSITPGPSQLVNNPHDLPGVNVRAETDSNDKDIPPNFGNSLIYQPGSASDYYQTQEQRGYDRYGQPTRDTITDSYHRRMNQVDEYWREEERQKKMYESQNIYRRDSSNERLENWAGCTFDSMGRPINCARGSPNSWSSNEDLISMHAPPQSVPQALIPSTNDSSSDLEADMEAKAERDAFEKANRVQLSASQWPTRDMDRHGVYPHHPACLLPPKWGVGPEERSAWFYSSTDGRCLWFSYAGHGGNANRFYSRANCESLCVFDLNDLCRNARCSYPGSRCMLRGDERCKEYAKSRGKDPETECPPDQPVCRARRAILPPEYDASMVPKECNEDMDAGGCLVKNPLIRYYYDARSNTCLAFYFHGCGGNNNRFESMQECMNHCAL